MAEALQRAHRLLCAPLIAEAEFRAALGGGRANVGTVARYLAQPAAERPVLTPYFDPLFYRIRNRDLPQDADLLLDFLANGLAAGQDPHPLIDLRHIADQDAMVGTPTAEALAAVLDDDLADPSPYFDRAFYAEQLDAPVSGGLLRHYLTRGIAAGLRPNRWLDPAWYAAAHDDVPPEPYAALRHFVVLGDPLGRPAGPMFDGVLYRRRYTDVADANMPPLRHFLAHGRAEGRQAAADRPRPAWRAPGPSAAFGPGEPAPVDPAAMLDLHARLRRQLADLRQDAKDAVRCRPPPWRQCRDPLAELSGLRLPDCPAPRLSILIAAHEQSAHTVACLLAIAAAPPGCGFEVVLVDDGSREPVYGRLRDVANLVTVRLPANGGFLRACNAGFALCRGEYVLLLNNDAQLLPGGVDRLMAAMQADPAIAAAGGRLLYPDGRLQEAGCFLRADGKAA